MKRSLISALLASLSLHTGVIAFTPTGQGWGSGKTTHAHPLQASLRLPTLAAKATGVATPEGLTKTDSNISTPATQVEEGPAGLAEESVTPTGFGLPLPEVPRHYESTELTDRPAALDALPPDLVETLPAGHSGRATLMMEIDEKGTVVSITPENSDIDSASLYKITEAFQGMRFLPGRIGKAPVKTRMRIEVTIDDWRNDLGGKDR